MRTSAPARCSAGAGSTAGQVVAQALRAAGLTVDEHLRPQSLHAYFVQAGDEHLPVLYEVERVRDSGSFATRQVVAYQARGAVLNLIASFHRPEASIDISAITAPRDVPAPESLRPTSRPICTSSGADVSRRIDPEPYELGLDARARAARRRPDAAGVRVRLLLRRVPARHRARRASGGAELGSGVHRQPRPRDLVPPAAARRRLAALRAAGRGRRRRARAGRSPGCSTATAPTWPRSPRRRWPATGAERAAGPVSGALYRTTPRTFKFVHRQSECMTTSRSRTPVLVASAIVAGRPRSAPGARAASGHQATSTTTTAPASPLRRRPSRRARSRRRRPRRPPARRTARRPPPCPPPISRR